MDSSKRRTKGRGTVKKSATSGSSVRMAPSDLAMERSLTTDQLLARASKGTSTDPKTKIVEFVGGLDPAPHRQSDVDIDRPLFIPSPDHIIFQNYVPFKVYEVPLRLRNQDKVGRRIKAIPPQSPHFTIIGPKFPGGSKSTTGKVAPGMDVEYTVRFVPDDVKDFGCELVFITDREKFVVPVQSIGARGMLDLPDRVVFEDALVKRTAEQALHVRNIGHSAARFTLKTDKMPPFSVTPTDGALEVGQATQINVGFTAERAGPYTGNLEVTFATGEILTVALIGNATDANVTLDRPMVRLDPTYITLESRAVAKLRNHSDVPVHFSWKKCASVSEELETRLQRSVMLAKEEGEARKRVLVADDDIVVDSRAADLAMIQRKFKQKRRELEADRFLFDDGVLSISPTEGELWPNSQVELTITFRPVQSSFTSVVAYCDVTGREQRLLLAIKAQGMGPNAVFAFDSLDLGDVFVESEHHYKIFMENRGEIPADWQLREEEDDDVDARADVFSFTPSSGTLDVGGRQGIEVNFSSSTLGSFNRTFLFDINGTTEPLQFVFRGTVIGPSFSFEEHSIDFGVIPWGFLASKTVTLMNTSEIPLRFTLRVPQTNPANREFEITPAQGALDPFSKRKFQMDFIPNAVKKYGAFLVVDVENVGEACLSLPVSATVVVPKITVADDHLDFGQVFVRYPVEREVIFVNESDVPAKYELVAQEEASDDQASYTAIPPQGVIPSQSDHNVSVRIKCRVPGVINVPMYFRIQGSLQAPIMVTLLAHSVGPTVSLDHRRIDFGKIDVLKEEVRKIKIINKSLIEAQYRAHSKGIRRPVFRVEPPEGAIPAQGELEVAVIANLDDSMRFKEELVFSIAEGESASLHLIAQGQGHTVVYKDEPLDKLDFGTQFCGNMQSKEFTLENKGRRPVVIKWTSGHDVEDRREGKKRGPIRPPSFMVLPAVASLDPRTQMHFKVEGTSFNPGIVSDNLTCVAQVGGAQRKDVSFKAKGVPIYDITVDARFIVPVLQFNPPKELVFTYNHEELAMSKETKRLAPQERPIMCKNVTKLPVDMTVAVDPPFSIDNGEKKQMVLVPGEEVPIIVIFDPGYKEDRTSEKIIQKLLITYANHPQEDSIDMVGDISFPDVELDVDHIDFGVTINDTEVTKQVVVTNPGRFPVSFTWSLFDDPDEFRVMVKDPTDSSQPPTPQSTRRGGSMVGFGLPGMGMPSPQGQWTSVRDVPINHVFDITPITGTLDPGASMVTEFRYFGFPNRRFKARATCEVRGGLEYFLRMYAEASELRYSLARKKIDFGLVHYDTITEQELVIFNNGLVGFDFVIHTDLLSRSDIIEVGTMQGHIPGQSKKGIKIRLRPGMPVLINEKLVVQVAHFNPEEIIVCAAGTYPRLVLSLPRTPDPEFLAYQDRARELIESGAELHPMVQSAGMAHDMVTPRSRPEMTPRTEASMLVTPRTDPRIQAMIDAQAELMAVQAHIEAARKIQHSETAHAEVEEEEEEEEYDSSKIVPALVPLSAQRLPPSARRTGRQPNLLSVQTAAADAGSTKYVVGRYILEFGHIVKGQIRRRQFRITNTGHTPAYFDVDSRKIVGSGFAAESTKSVKLLGLPKCDGTDFGVSIQSRSSNIVTGPLETSLFVKIRGGAQIEIILRTTVVLPDLRILPDFVDFSRVLCGQCRVVYVQLHNHKTVPVEWEAAPPMRIAAIGGVDEGTDRLGTMASGRMASGRVSGRGTARSTGGGVSLSGDGMGLSYGSSNFQNFAMSPSSGTLLPSERINVAVRFTPTEHRLSSAMFQFRIANSTSAQKLQVRGYGVNLNVRVENYHPGESLDMDVVLPYAAPSERTVAFLNPTDYPIEVYASDFDKQHVLEEDVLSSFPAYVADTFLLPPRAAGEPLFPMLVANHQTRKRAQKEKIEAELAKVEAEAAKQEEEEEEEKEPEIVPSISTVADEPLESVDGDATPSASPQATPVSSPIIKPLEISPSTAPSEPKPVTPKPRPLTGSKSPDSRSTRNAASMANELGLGQDFPALYAPPRSTIPVSTVLEAKPTAINGLTLPLPTMAPARTRPPEPEPNPRAVTIFVHGPPCSGRSTISQQLANTYHATVLSLDGVLREYAKGHGPLARRVRVKLSLIDATLDIPALDKPKMVPFRNLQLLGPDLKADAAAEAEREASAEGAAKEREGREGRRREDRKRRGHRALARTESRHADSARGSTASLVQSSSTLGPDGETIQEPQVDVQVTAAMEARDALVAELEKEVPHLDIPIDLIYEVLCDRVSKDDCKWGVIVDGLQSVVLQSHESVMSMWLSVLASMPHHFRPADVILLDAPAHVCRERSSVKTQQAAEDEKKRLEEAAALERERVQAVTEDEYDAMSPEEQEKYDALVRQYLTEKRKKKDKHAEDAAETAAEQETEVATPAAHASVSGTLSSRGTGSAKRRERAKDKGEKRKEKIVAPITASPAPSADGEEENADDSSMSMIDVRFELLLHRFNSGGLEVVQRLPEAMPDGLPVWSKIPSEIKVDSSGTGEAGIEAAMSILQPPVLADPSELAAPIIPQLGPIGLPGSATYDVIRKPRRRPKRPPPTHFSIHTPAIYAPFGPLVPPPPKPEESVAGEATVAIVEEEELEKEERDGRRDRRKDRRGRRSRGDRLARAKSRDVSKEEEPADPNASLAIESEEAVEAEEKDKTVAVPGAFIVEGVHQLVHPSIRTRWIIPARGRLELVVSFATNRIGNYTQSLEFCIANLPQGAPGREIVLYMKARCGYPQLVKEPRAVFCNMIADYTGQSVEKARAGRKQTRSRGFAREARSALSKRDTPIEPQPDHVMVALSLRGQSLAQSGALDFGPLLVTRSRDGMHDRRDREHYEILHLTNNGSLDANVTISLQNDQHDTFHITPSEVTLAPFQSEDITLFCYPDSVGEIDDALVILIKDNPVPIVYPLHAVGTRPEVSMSAKSFVFERLLLGRKETNSVTMTNLSRLPIQWRLTDHDLGDEFVVSPTSGMVDPGEDATVKVKFSAIKTGTFKKNFKVEIYDGHGVNPQSAQTESLSIVAEAYEVSLDVQFPKNNEGEMLNFGVLRVAEESKQAFTVRNRGKYHISLRFEVKGQLANLVTVSPSDIMLPAGDKIMTITVTFLATSGEVNLRNCADLICYINEAQKESKDLLAEMPVHVSVRAVYSKFRVLPQMGINFGPLLTGSKRSRTFELFNDGEFDLRYKAAPHEIPPTPGRVLTGVSKVEKEPEPVLAPIKAEKKSRRGGLTSRGAEASVSGEARRGDRKKERKAAGVTTLDLGDGLSDKALAAPLPAGPFTVIPGGGVIPPKSSATITVEFAAEGAAQQTEMIAIEVSDRDPRLPRLAYELAGEAVEPGVNTWEFSSIFEEQTVTARRDMLKASQHSVYASDDRAFTFGAITAGTRVEERIKLVNPYKVPCEVTVSIRPKSKGMNLETLIAAPPATPIRESEAAPAVGRGGKRRGAAPASGVDDRTKDDPHDVAAASAFEAVGVKGKKLLIPQYQHKYVTVAFTPMAMQSYVAFFDAVVDGATPGAKSSRLAFELHGDGTLPHVVVEMPTELTKEGAVLVNFGRLLLGKKLKRRVILRNEGIVPATVRWDFRVPLPPSVTTSIKDRDIIVLDPQQRQTFEVSFAPTDIAKLSTEIRFHVEKNQFEDTVLSMVGEGYQDDVTFEGIPPPPEGLPGVSPEESMIMFDECAVGLTQQFTFTLDNHCSSAVRFAWPVQAAEQDLVFRPSIGHIAPRKSKVVTLSFSPRQPRQHNRYPVQCVVQKINYKPKDKSEDATDKARAAETSADWDDTRRITRPEHEIVAEQASTQTAKPDKKGKKKAAVDESLIPPSISDVVEETSDGTRMVQTVEPEPLHEVQKGSERKMELRVTAVADWASYECGVTRVPFAQTLMFQKRQFVFPLKNASAARMEFSFQMMHLDGTPDEFTGRRGDDVPAFRVVPEDGVIAAGQTETITIWFEPTEVDTYERMLVCQIPNLHESAEPLVIELSGSSMRPLCHFELAESDYLSSGRRNPELRGPAGQLGVDADTRVIEVKSCGIKVKNFVRFYVLNPTSFTYEFTWVREDQQNDELEAHQSLRCNTSTGMILPGKKYEMVFEFIPEDLDLHESFWRFVVADHNVRVPFLVVGTASEPDVGLDRTHINFKACLVGKKTQQTVSLVNSEVVPFAFIIDRSTFDEAEMTISPLRGVVPPNSSVPLNVTLSSKEEREYNTNVGINVKNKPTPVSLNVKGQSYVVRCKVLLETGEGDIVELKPGAHNINNINFGAVQINDRKVRRIRVVNGGRLNFDFTLSLEKRSRVLFVEPSRGEAKVNNSSFFDLTYRPLKESVLKARSVVLSISNGPVYVLSLNGVGKKPGLVFSFDEHDFGTCFVQREGVEPTCRVLKVTNEDDASLSFETKFDCPEWLQVGAATTVLALGESSEIPITFQPPAETKYSTEIPFEINGCYIIPVTVSGEGAEPRVELQKPDMEVVGFGAIRTMQSAKRSIRLVNRSRILCKVKLYSINLERRGVTFSPGHSGKTLKLGPKEGISIDFLFKSNHRVAPFSGHVELEIVGAGIKRPLCEVTGAVHGYDLKLENELLNFGAVVLQSHAVRRLQMSNSGDIGCKFKWATKRFEPDFSIRPAEGYIHPGTDVTFDVTYTPNELNDDVRYNKLPCVTDAGKLYLTLTGMCTAQPLDSADTVTLKCPVRERDSAKIKVANPGPSAITVRPTISHEAFSGAPTIDVPAGGSAQYEILYRPLSMTTEESKHVGTVFFPLGDGNGLVYHIVGIAQPPLPSSQVSRDIPAKKIHTEKLTVTNWLNLPQRFRVTIDLDRSDPATIARGLPSIDLPPLASREFELTFVSHKDGNNKAVVTLTNPETGEYMFHEVAFKIQTAGLMDTLHLESTVRQLHKRQIAVANPLSHPVVAQCTCTANDVQVPDTVTLTPGVETPILLRYLPLLVHAAPVDAKVTVSTQELGQFVFGLVLKSSAASHEQNMMFSCALGGSQVQTFRFLSYCRQKTDYVCKVDGGDFETDKTITAVPATSGPVDMAVDVTYEPTQLGDQRATLTLKSAAGGEYIAPLFGHCVSPRPQGPLVVKFGGSVSVPFKNVFSSAMEFTFTVDNPLFSIGRSKETIQPKKTANISISYHSHTEQSTVRGKKREERSSSFVAPSSASQTGKLIVACGNGLSWIYYLKGV